MNKYYDASQEFKPFPNRTVGGALKEDLTYIKDRRPKRAKKAKRWEGPNTRVRVCKSSGHPYLGYHYVRLRDGAVIGSEGK